MPRPSNAVSRRNEIVQAALQVIGRLGYARASTVEIARVAGLAPGLIHYHFKDKRSILLALTEWLAATARSRFEERLANRASSESGNAAKRALHAWVDARLGLGDDANLAAVAAWVMIGREAVSDPQVREVYEAALAAEKQLLRELLSAAGATESQVDELAAAALAFAEGSFALASATRDLLPAGFAAPALRRLLDGVLPVPD